MKVAIFTLTSNGLELGSRLLSVYTGAKFYALDKFKSNLASPYRASFKETIELEFDNRDVLIFICATGIVIRSIAPLLKSKTTDPAVIVMDDNGNNIISLLSGHIGGANDETIKIARLLKSNPVITTASDVNKKASVDMIAKDNKLLLVDFKAARDITSRIIDNEKVLIIDDYNKEIDNLLSVHDLDTRLYTRLIDHRAIDKSSDIKDHGKATNIDDYSSYILVTNKNKLDNIPQKPCVYLYPKNIIIGIGCRRGTSSDHIINMITRQLYNLNISVNSIKHVASVDIKSDEAGLIEACKVLNVPLVIISRDEILKVEDKYEGSDFVKETIGVRAVSEPSCELTSVAGEFLVRKNKDNGATISIWEEKC